MGFSMFAWGYRGHARGKQIGRRPFTYHKKDCLSQGDFEPPAILSAIPDSPNLGGVATKIVGTPESHVGGATVKGFMKLAEMEFAHLVATTVTLLAMDNRRGEISVYCYQDNMVWADTNSFETFNFANSAGNPGKDFLKKIGPGLVKTELNDFGVLAEIALVLSGYYKEKPKGVKTMLRMEIRH